MAAVEPCASTFDVDIDMRHDRGRSAEQNERLAAWCNEFVWIFDPEPFRDLGEAVLSSLTEETCGVFLSLSNCAPVAVLWQALGATRAAGLPGVLGTMLIPAGRVETALAQVRDAMAGLDLDLVVQRGHALCGFRDEISQVRPVLHLIQDGLQRALSMRRGFLAVGRPEL